MKKHTIWLAAVAAASVALSGCASGAGNAATPENGGTEGATGGTLTYIEAQAWNTLYPPSGGFYPNGAVLNQITDRLLYQDPETLELTPWIAAELPEVNEDTTEFTFTIREGVTYSDGSPLDAANVAKNIDLYATGDTDRVLTHSEVINNYVGSDVVDDHTVTFTFSEPSPGFSQAVSTINSGLLSNDTLERSSDEFGPGNATEIIGSGPFIITDETLNSELTFETRQDYDWAPPSRPTQGRAAIDGITLLVSEEASVRVGSVVSGQADIARQIPAPDEAQFGVDGLELFVAPTNGVNNSLYFRFGHPLLEDIRVREAIIAGIDREQIVDTLFTDSYALATGVLAETAQGYSDTSSYYEYDPERARELLDEAGWEVGTNGIRVKDSEPLSLTFNEALPLQRSKDVITLIQTQLADIGIEVHLFPGDQAAQNEARDDVNTIQVYHQLVGRSDYEVLKSQFYSNNRNVLLNYDRVSDTVLDEHLDELLAEIASLRDGEDREAASIKAQEYLAEKAYTLPLFEEPLVYGLGSHVEGFITESIGRPSFYDVSLNR